VNPPDEEETIKKLFNELESDFNSNEGWTDEGVQKGAKCHSKFIAGCPYKYIKLEATVDCPYQAFITYLADNETIGEADPTTEFAGELIKYPGGSRLTYVIARPGFPFYNRDFVDFNCYKQFENPTRFITIAKSFPDSLPELHNNLRGEILRWGYLCKPVEGEKTHLILVNLTDLRGWMPSFILNRMVMPVLMDYIYRLAEVAKRKHEEETERK